MTDKPKIHEERLEQLMAYYGGDLSGDELAEFEAHLASCADCQSTLQQAKEVLPVAEAILAFKPKRTIDEQVARFEKMWAEKRKEEDAARYAKRRFRRWLGLLIGLGVALAVGFFLWTSRGAVHPRPDHVYAPTRDGG